MKNRYGYTMLELLAVIIILVILITLAYMGVSKYLNQTRDAVYEDFEKNIEVGAENYLLGHTGQIPLEGESLVIDVSKLICDGYVESLEDPKDSSKTCNTNSYAIITRKDDVSFNMDVEYSICLKCTNYESEACSTPLTGITRLTKDASCEVE